MGSKVTADERIVRLILTACKKHGLFYLDSKTNPNSVVPQIGKELGVPIIENQLFFDDVYTAGHISKQAQLLIKKIQEKPIMVAIGHVGPPGEITSRVIETSIPKIREHADFIFLSDLALSPPAVSK